MSASSPSLALAKLPQVPNILAELLHSLSQPLTSLQCSLELSLVNALDHSRELSFAEVAKQQHESFSVALQQTGKVIGMIQLMREYLDAWEPGPPALPIALGPVLEGVIDDLTSIAAVRNIQLRLTGTGVATLPVPRPQFQLALQYLIAAMIDAQPAGGKVTLQMGEEAGGTVLRGDGEYRLRKPNRCGADVRGVDFRGRKKSVSCLKMKREPAAASASTLRRVRRAIASCVLEKAGASLVIVDNSGGDPIAFVLRIPHRIAHRHLDSSA